VALYPHAGCYTDTAPNCLRLAKLAGRDNVGVSFNLCHFLSQTDPTKLEAELADLSPWLMLVSINGAENPPRSSILPLGQGGFDTGRVIRTLDKIGYRGPVGLQCFQIPKPARERLATSIKAWRKLCATPVPAAETKFKPGDPAPANSPAPTMVSDVPYGPHPKQVLHFWKAKSKRNTPLLFEIHGGGWIGGGRMSGLAGLLEPMLAAGISVVSIEYRFLDESTKDGVTPPIKGPMDDAARALQFVRSKAHEWDIDKRRIVASGSSAGACTALWLAFHDDMADPKSNDPVARESTRLFAVAANNAQTTLDPQQMREWIPNSVYGSLAFGIIKPGTKGVMDFEPFFARRDELLPLIKAYSPYYLATSDDPPVYLIYKTPPAIGQPQQDPTHSANFGVKLEELLREIKVECELVYPGAPAVIRSDMVEFITAKFTKTKQE
jgi:acetyl esterase/lipase